MCFVFFILLGYLLGSIIMPILFFKLGFIHDPRLYASKNPGFSNVLRLFGFKKAIFILLFDVLKTYLFFYFVSKIFSYFYINFIAIVFLLGNIFPIFYSFHGGKGVLCMISIVLFFNFKIGCALCTIWCFLFYLLNCASFASLIVSFISIFFEYYYNCNILIFSIFSFLMILYRHFNYIMYLFY